MRKYAEWIWLVAVLLFSTSWGVAAASEVGDAQAYGIKGVNVSQEEFMAPWSSYEEKAVKLTEGADQAYCYTPFLVVALDAKGKMAGHLPVYVQDGEKLWQQYAGYLTFALRIDRPDNHVPQHISVWLEQDKVIYSPVQSVMPSELAVVGKHYLFTPYFYFADDGIRHDQPVVLCMTIDEKGYRFFFNLKGIH